MTRIVTASIPEDLVPTWDRLKEDFNGASSFFQEVLRMVAKASDHKDAPAARAVSRLVVERRRDYLLAQKESLDTELKAVDAYLADPASHTAPPVTERKVASLEDVVVWAAKEFGAVLDKRTDRELNNFGRARGYDGRAFCEAYRKHRADNPDKPAEVPA